MSDERCVTLSEVKELLDSESKARELSNEQKLAFDHAQRLSKLPLAKAEALFKELKIVDILPSHPDDVRILFAKERSILEKKQVDQILKVVEKYH